MNKVKEMPDACKDAAVAINVEALTEYQSA